MATASKRLTDQQVIGMLKPEYQPSPVFTPHECAVEYLNDFGGCYARSFAARRTLQNAIDAADPQNLSVAPSERQAYINSAVAYFSVLVDQDSSLDGGDRTRRLDQLKRSLENLESRHELDYEASLAR